MKALVALALVAGAVLGYGYWHSSTHAWFHIQVEFDDGRDGRVPGQTAVEVQLRDASGELLAKGVLNDQFDFVELIHPEAGNCHTLEASGLSTAADRTAWQQCAAQLATWIPRWADRVHTADILAPLCSWSAVPATPRKGNDAWLWWWVPLPHVGGKPHRYYYLTLRPDAGSCTGELPVQSGAAATP